MFVKSTHTPYRVGRLLSVWEVVKEMNARLLKELESLVDEHRQQLETLQSELNALEVALTIARRKVEEEDQSEQGSPAARSKTIRNTMVEILKGTGQPMHYGDIHKALEERGVKVPGQDPRKNVGAHLSNDERFESLGSGRWQLRSWGKSATPPAKPISLQDRVQQAHSPQTPSYGSWNDDEAEPTDEELNHMSDVRRVSGGIPF